MLARVTLKIYQINNKKSTTIITGLVNLEKCQIKGFGRSNPS